jgi:hypothetical protein
MYHYTNYEAAVEILKSGFIKPNSETGGGLDNTIQKDVVYLSDSTHNNEYGDILFEVSVNGDNVRADDDSISEDEFLEEFLKLCEEKGADTEKFENVDSYDFRHELAPKYVEDTTYGPIILQVLKNAWDQGWADRENMAYVGSIPVSQITSMEVCGEEADEVSLEELERLGAENRLV